jgi:pre-mRNA-splicing factor 38A
MNQEEIRKAPSGMSEANPMMSIDAIVRNKIFNSRYWKEECFGLNAETLVDKAI